MKTPHRAISLCCHETFDGRMTEHNHTPSMKAGQLSRHSCNQIPRGRYQQTKVQAGPEHQTRQPAGREGKGDRERNHNKGRQTTKEATGPTQAQRGGQQNQEDNEAHQQEHKTNTIPRPPQDNMQGATRPPKGQRAAQTILVQSVVRLTKEKVRSKPKRNHGKGACTQQEGTETKK